ncbi:DUF58 domain-containing protein [Nocardioides sp. R-C-SC26]|uniref:DUF58 domain-containing protein n=1 Tax=Nocardioides sp. R-C-SC26 TaxID=2870414 RepID=UPI001E3885C9|nr:DUF58 domain-containing protein [Nocardioides sp. R-C-SC26]
MPEGGTAQAATRRPAPRGLAAGLTTRGRAFIAAGITAATCSIVLGHTTLTQVGVLLTALPIVTALVIGRGRYRLALARTVTPRLVSAGQPATVTLTLTNEGRRPTGVLLLEEQVPFALGTRPRFIVDGVRRGWQRRVTYTVRSDVRGRFEVGPMRVRVSDAFGLVELMRTFSSVTTVTVTPPITDLPPIGLGGGRSSAGDQRPREFTSGSAEDVTVRDYRQGDDLRRVHWRSSARWGELMVRREEQPWQAHATILLDDRLIAHRGLGLGSSFEAAVTATASIAAHLGRRGYQVHLTTTSGSIALRRHASTTDESALATLLEALAGAHTSPAGHIGVRLDGGGEPGGVTVAVLGHVEDRDQAALRRLRAAAGLPLAVVLDVDAWDTQAEHAVPRLGQANLQLVRRAGWRGAALTPRGRLDAVWEQLGHAGATGGSPPPAAVSSATAFHGTS